MDATEPTDGVPYWTEQMYKPGGGQDHLGLGSVVTDRILPRLSPGINVLTTHPRYWSFYSFVLSEFWDRDLPRSKVAFTQWYRPLECIFSIACELCADPGHRGSPVGSRKVSGLVASNPTAFDPRFDYMKTPMGGYGLYYGSVMQSLGLVVLADAKLGLPVDTVTPVGQLVAAAFRQDVAETAYYRDWIDQHDEPVPSEVVEEYATRACLCRLRKDDVPDRPLLVDAFLHNGNPADSAARRSTLQFMCELSSQTTDFPLDQGAFRRLVYFGADHSDSDSNRREFLPTTPIESTARRWRLYQAREYYNAALNEMWRRLISWGLAKEGDVFPISISDVMGSLDEIDFYGLATSLGLELPEGGIDSDSPFSNLLEWVRDQGSVDDSLDGPWKLDAHLTEDALISWLGYGRPSKQDGGDVLAACLALLALVAARLWNPVYALQAPDDWFPVAEGGNARLGMQRFLTQLRKRVEGGDTVIDVARWLTSEYVIEQHERVATAKLDTTGDTFRFRREQGRVRFFQKEALVAMNDSRFNALSTFLYELGWSGNLYERGHELTAEGQRVREDGDLPPSGGLIVRDRA
jgi:hypothetical protein